MSQVTHADHIINHELLRMARSGLFKQAFVPGAGMDPSQGGAPPPGDPSQGGAPPPPGDPSQGGAPPGGAPPGGPDILQTVLQKLTTLEQGMAAGGAGGAAGGGALKPKVDVNVVLLQILKILARIADAQGIQIPASEMVPGQGDLGQLAQATQSGQPLPGSDPTLQQGGAGGGAGAIPPMPPMDPSGVPGQQKAGSYREQGHAFDPGAADNLEHMGKRASAILLARRAARESAA